MNEIKCAKDIKIRYFKYLISWQARLPDVLKTKSKEQYLDECIMTKQQLIPRLIFLQAEPAPSN